MIINIGMIKLVYKNERYKILEYNSKYFLIDCDASVLGYICFIFNWITPQKVYLLSSRDADDLMTSSVDYKSRKNSKLWLEVFSIISIMAIFILAVRITLKTDAVNFLILAIISLGVLILRIYYSKSKKLEIHLKSELVESDIIIKPTMYSEYIKNTCAYLLFLSTIFLGAFLGIISGGFWLILIMYCIVVYFFLLSNRLAYRCGEYKVVFRKEK